MSKKLDGCAFVCHAVIVPFIYTCKAVSSRISGLCLAGLVPMVLCTGHTTI